MLNLTEVNQKDVQCLLDFCNQSVVLESLPKADAIFLFANHETDRAKEVAKLINMGKASFVIVTGGFNHYPELLPKEYKTESDFLVGILKSEGIPENKIILENTPQNLLENVLFGMKKVIEQNAKIDSLILFSWSPLIRRAEATFKKHFPQIEIYSYGFNLPVAKILSSDDLLRLLGEIERYKIYSGKADIAQIVIPDDVNNAYLRLLHIKDVQS